MESSPATDSVKTDVSSTVEISSANFWKVWSGNGLSNLGDGLYQVTLPLLAAQLTRSPSQIALLGVMSSLPWLIFALQAGSIVDRSDRRNVMVWVNGVRLVILSVLTFATMTGNASLPMLYVAALLLGVGETLVDTALTSLCHPWYRKIASPGQMHGSPPCRPSRTHSLARRWQAISPGWDLPSRSAPARCCISWRGLHFF